MPGCVAEDWENDDHTGENRGDRQKRERANRRPPTQHDDRAGQHRLLRPLRALRRRRARGRGGRRVEASLEGETARDNGQHGNLRDVHGVFGRFSTERCKMQKGEERGTSPHTISCDALYITVVPMYGGARFSVDAK